MPKAIIPVTTMQAAYMRIVTKYESPNNFFIIAITIANKTSANTTAINFSFKFSIFTFCDGISHKKPKTQQPKQLRNLASLRDNPQRSKNAK